MFGGCNLHPFVHRKYTYQEDVLYSFQKIKKHGEQDLKIYSLFKIEKIKIKISRRYYLQLVLPKKSSRACLKDIIYILVVHKKYNVEVFWLKEPIITK